MQKIILVMYVLIPLVAFAQPQAQSIALYDLKYFDVLSDVYALQNGGYVACGCTNERRVGYFSYGSNNWIIKTDNELNLEWSLELGEDDVGEYGFSIIEVSAGGYLIGGVTFCDLEQTMTAWRVSENGELMWSRNCGVSQCWSVIELKSGEYLLAGQVNGRMYAESGVVVCLDEEGNQQWRTTYTIDGRGGCPKQMRETQRGVILVGGSSPDRGVWVLKIDPANEGEEIWSNLYQFGHQHSSRSIVADPAGGFIIAGGVKNLDDGCFNDWLILKIQDNGELDWSRTFDFGNSWCETAKSIERLSPTEYIVVGETDDDNAIMKINQNGDVIRSFNYSRNGNFDFIDFESVVKSPDEGYAIAGFGLSEDDDDYNGFICKFAPVIEAPQFILWTPEDTVLTVLQGDAVVFSVFAEDDQNDDISTSWFVADTLFLQGDTTITVVYDSLGVFETQCRISDGNFTNSITWHITVDDFFIRETSPDSLRLLTRRGSTLPFTLDIACVEPDAPTIEWSTVNRDNDREYLGEADSIDVLFDLAGEWAVETEASWNGERESVRWAVDVRSAVWWWMPHEDAISVNRNERREFSIFPFEPDSDSLSVAWWLDGDSLDCVAEALSLDLPELGEHNLTTIVRDGVEADTISWQITVNESGVVSDGNAIPTELALHPPAPNPFNSTTTIGYSLPESGNVSLTVYDLAGREVARLVDAVQSAGTHEAVWQADGMASGVYVVSLRTGGVMLREKVVLVK